MLNVRSRAGRRAPAWLLLLLAATFLWSPARAAAPRLRTLIVGGGPEARHNQVAIERNVYYVSHLLPAGSPRWVLFTNGDAAARTVLYEEAPPAQPTGERLFALLFDRDDDTSSTIERYRAPQLGKLDGPARLGAISQVFGKLRAGPPDPVLLYFTGHGSPGRHGDLNNNTYDLWGEALSVRELAAQVATLPAEVPVTLVMVQCFSGAFGNLIFANGDPEAAPVQRSIAGFFAAPQDRMAAGCTPAVNEAEYHDFTSYFFAALTGRDRVGRKVSGADYNHDGRVGMDEAFAYSLIHDTSIDVPVCTSDVYLRQVVPATDSEVFQSDYEPVRSWATPAQGAALDALAASLNLPAEARLGEAYRMLMASARFSSGAVVGQARRRFLGARQQAQEQLLARWPALRRPERAGYPEARAAAVAALDRQTGEGWVRDLVDAMQAMERADEQAYQGVLRQARVLRFCRLAKSVILAHRLRESGNRAATGRLEQLLKDEAGSCLPPVAARRDEAAR